MMNSNLNLSALPECKFAYQMVNSALLIPCIEYQRVLHVEKVAHIAGNFSEYEGEYSRERLCLLYTSGSHIQPPEYKRAYRTAG